MSDNPEAVGMSIKDVDQAGNVVDAAGANPAATKAPAGATGTETAYSESARTMDELRVKAPKVYKMMIKSLCMGMIHQMHTHRERLHRLNQQDS